MFPSSPNAEGIQRQRAARRRELALMTNYVELPDSSIHNELDADTERRLYAAMWNFWHPVMYAGDLRDDPEPAVLLGEQPVLARMEGAVRCFRDLCCHRGAALSLGWNEGNQLRCLYHGWTYEWTVFAPRYPLGSV